MRNLTVLLLLLAVCAVALSADIGRRSSYTDDDTAMLEALLEVINSEKGDVNGFQDREISNPNRRWYKGKK